MTSHTACHRDSISMLTNVDHWSRFNMCCILITSQLNCAFYCRSVSVCVYLLDWEVLRGLPMYFRMGFLFLSSPSFSFSFLVPLSCRKKKTQNKNQCKFLSLPWLCCCFNSHLFGLQEKQPFLLLCALTRENLGVSQLDARVTEVQEDGPSQRRT